MLDTVDCEDMDLVLGIMRLNLLRQACAESDASAWIMSHELACNELAEVCQLLSDSRPQSRVDRLMPCVAKVQTSKQLAPYGARKRETRR